LDAAATLSVTGLEAGNTFNIGWENIDTDATGNYFVTPGHITFTAPTTTITSTTTPVSIPAAARAPGETHYWI